MEISGYCETLHIPQITAILKKGGRTFRLVKDTIAEEVYSFTDEEKWNITVPDTERASTGIYWMPSATAGQGKRTYFP